jgi:NAD(P)-dependent dehydrogenase (short-subunit alcohol dehydrogenase family)
MSSELRHTVVVTGACGGMGGACVARFAPRARVIAVDIDPARVDALADEWNAKGHDVVPAALDIATAGAAVELAQLTVRSGAPSALVHTAGLSPTMGDPERIMAVNLIATQRLADAFIEIAVPGFAAVIIASIAAHSVRPEGALADLLMKPLAPDFWTNIAPFCPNSEASYAFSKWGAMILCEREAAKWGRKGARINSVSPGVIDTPMGRREAAHQGTVMEMMIKICPAGRWGRPEDIAGAVEYLCSDAASFVTGVDLRVDGGTIPALRYSTQ